MFSTLLKIKDLSVDSCHMISTWQTDTDVLLSSFTSLNSTEWKRSWTRSHRESNAVHHRTMTPLSEFVLDSGCGSMLDRTSQGQGCSL